MTEAVGASRAVAALLLLAACSAGSAPAAPAGPAEGARRSAVGLVAEPASLDFTTKDGAAIPQALLDNVYETLVQVDQDGKIGPALASKSTVSQRRQDLHLRPRPQRHVLQREDVHR